MSDTGENYTTFNSRTLVEIVGDVTDEALKATKIKQLLAFLLADFSTGRAKIIVHTPPWNQVLCNRDGGFSNSEIRRRQVRSSVPF